MPAYDRPPAPIAAQWRGQPDEQPSEQSSKHSDEQPSKQSSDSPDDSAPLPAWESVFNDGLLRELISEALAHNRDLRIAVQRIDEARAVFGVAGADLLPTLGVQGATQRQQLSARDSPTGQRVISEQGRFRLGVGITAYEIDVWGRVRALRESAAQQLLASEDDARAVQISLVGEVASSYYEALTYLSLRASHEAQLHTGERAAQLIERRRSQGLASELEVRQAQSLVLGLQAERAVADRGFVLALNRLERLAGKGLEPMRLQAAALDAEQPLLPVRPGLPSALLTRRPDVRAAESRLKSFNANIGAARAAYLPRISLTGLLGFSSPQLGHLLRGGAKAWSFTPEVTLPLFDLGRRESQLALAKAQRDIAVSQYEATVQQAFREVADALGSSEPISREVDTQRLRVANEAKRVELATLLYQEGLDSYLEVLDAQRSLSAAQQGFIRARLAKLNNGVSLYKALGGGWG